MNRSQGNNTLNKTGTSQAGALVEAEKQQPLYLESSHQPHSAVRLVNFFYLTENVFRIQMCEIIC